MVCKFTQFGRGVFAFKVIFTLTNCYYSLYINVLILNKLPYPII